MLERGRAHVDSILPLPVSAFELDIRLQPAPDFWQQPVLVYVQGSEKPSSSSPFSHSFIARR